MKLRFFMGILILILVAALTSITALADVIWTPNDKFFETEYQNCVYLGRSYTADGKDGSVTVHRVPESGETVADIKNGSTFYVSFTYDDKSGERWGVVEYAYDEAGNVTPEYSYKGETGWIRMTDLSLIYDYISFDSDHQSEFKPYTGTYEEFKTGDKIVFWSYPGSGVIAREDVVREIGKLFSITKTYTDTENRVWGFVDYYYGTKQVWVCISNPSGVGIETVQTPAPTGSETQNSQSTASPLQPNSTSPVLASPGPSLSPSDNIPTVHNDQTPMLLIIAAAVLVLIIITGVLIAVFWRKNTKKDKAVK